MLFRRFFNGIVAYIKMPKVFLSFVRMWKIFNLFQSTVGDVTGDKPGAFDFAGKAKYTAWQANSGILKVLYLFLIFNFWILKF